MIKLDKVSKVYEGKSLFNNLTYSFEKNSLYVITGDSGSGKTTILDLIYEITKPSSGSVVNSNVSIAYDALESFFFNKYTVFENICYILKIKNKQENLPLVEKYLKMLNIHGCKHKSIDHLSIGQKKRIGIVAALALNFDYYILDEPYADLDRANRNKVTSLIKTKVNEGKTVIITSHQRELFDDYDFKQFKVSDKISIYSYSFKELENENIIKKPLKKMMFKDLINVGIRLRHLMIGLMIALISLSLLFFQNNYLNEKNYFDDNIFVMNNTNDSLMNYYDNIFDYVSGDLEYDVLDLKASSPVIALPITLYSNNYDLKDNEIVISSLIYDIYHDKSFESLGIKTPKQLIKKVVYFNEKNYIVKEVIELDTNVVFISDDQMRNYEIIIFGKSEKLHFINDEIILKEGNIPTNNNKYIEIIGDISLNVGDVIDDLFLVTGISSNNDFYIREEDFKKYYLQNVKGKKVLYNNEKSDIENILKISSISYKNLKDEADREFENIILIQEESNQDYIVSILILTIVLVIIVAIIDFYQVKNKIDMHRFMKNSDIWIYANIIFNIVFKYLIIYVFSILIFNILKVVLVYTYNMESFVGNFAYLFKYGLICLLTNIVVMSGLYLLNKVFNRLNMQIRNN